ncbi:MAG TPA: EF-hand domain-containing protein [Albitalea sp.]|uniref:EF-hand domain-containing protein n=1 Tax=Piscinibacter sp. TaxID=1903157 RepID=UPI002ED3589C
MFKLSSIAIALALGAAMGAQAQTAAPGSQAPAATTTAPGTATGTAAPTTGASPTSSSAATIEAAFKRADVNGDGRLSSSELAQIPALASKFGDLDKDKDGFVSNAEFSAGVSVKSN